jgi:hypothetical protein
MGLMVGCTLVLSLPIRIVFYVVLDALELSFFYADGILFCYNVVVAW